MFQFSCPQCQQVLEGDESYQGQEVICPTCNTQFVVPSIEPVAAVTPQPVDPQAMPIVPVENHQQSESAFQFQCPKCQRILEGDESLQGQTVICRLCNTQFSVPVMRAVVETEPQSVEHAVEWAESPPPQPVEQKAAPLLPDETPSESMPRRETVTTSSREVPAKRMSKTTMLFLAVIVAATVVIVQARVLFSGKAAIVAIVVIAMLALVGATMRNLTRRHRADISPSLPAKREVKATVTVPILVVVLILIVFANFHIITGGSVGLKVVKRNAMGFREFLIDLDQITSMPYLAAVSRYPIGCSILQREGMVESTEKFQERVQEEVKDSMDKAMGELSVSSSGQARGSPSVVTEAAARKTSTPSSRSVSRNASPSITIKGLCMGMPLEDAYKQCVKLLSGSGCSVGGIQKGGLYICDIGIAEGSCFGFTAMGIELAGGGVTADAQGKVNGFVMSGGIVNDLFGSSEMEASDFVQKFIDSYDIPEFKVSDDYTYWYYDSPDSIRIEITEGKQLTVKQTPKQKFD